MWVHRKRRVEVPLYWSCEGGNQRLTPFSYGIEAHRLHPSFSVERDARTSPDAVAKLLPALAHRDLYRAQNAEHWLSRVLGIQLARTARVNSFPHLDRRDGALCAGEAEKPLAIATSAESRPPACRPQPKVSLPPTPAALQFPSNQNCQGWQKIRHRRLPHTNGKPA
jgi:hypothetical protein